MARDMLRLIIYPALADGLDPDEESELRWVAMELDLDEDVLVDALARRISYEEMLLAAAQVPLEYREDAHGLAEQLAARGGLTRSEREALDEMAQALGLEGSRSDFTAFEALAAEQELEDAFHRMARRYAMIAGAVGLLPTPIISDFTILAPLQVYMVNRIARLYDYPLDAGEFLKMAAGTVGVGYLCAVGARSLLAMVPVAGWAVAGAVAFAGTYAIAVLTSYYIDHDGDVSGESMRDIFKSAFSDGKNDFHDARRDIQANSEELLDELKRLRKRRRP